MNTSSRVPGVSRNSGWQAVDAEIDARRERQRQNGTSSVQAQPRWMGAGAAA
jgi:hypothetical protein